MIRAWGDEERILGPGGTGGPVEMLGPPCIQTETPERTIASHPALGEKDVELHNCSEEFRIKNQRFAEADLAEIVTPPARVIQERTTAREARQYHLVLHLTGHGTYRGTDGDFEQSPGDIALLNIGEYCEWNGTESARILRCTLPADLLGPFLPPPKQPVHHFLPAQGGLNAVLTGFICELARQAQVLDHTAKRGLLTHLCGLIGLALQAGTPPRMARRCNYRAYQRQRVLSYIEINLRDPCLTAKRAAKDLGISQRWLHALFTEIAGGFTNFVAKRRLEHSLEQLRDPGCEHLSIAEIAFLSGFNDLSTFYRRFGERYGMAPGAARRPPRLGSV